MKTCTRCGHEKVLTAFYVVGKAKSPRPAAWCRDCYHDYRNSRIDVVRRNALKHYYNNWDKAKRARSEYMQRERYACLSHYSNGAPRCACCGESEIKFLGIDHVAGGGTKHRREIAGRMSISRWLKKHGYPSGYRVLCHNCNLASGFYGACPHAENVDPLWAEA